jgi:CRP/FNR family transcriptional regulator, dissimilatory nitrate respiration regulator
LFKQQMNRLEEKTDFLNQCPLFSGMERDDLVSIARLSHFKKCRSGEILFRKDEEATGFYLVYRGSVKVSRITPDGREHVLHVIRPGHSFGEAAIFSGVRFPATAEALEPGECLYLPREPFVGWLERHPEAALSMLAGLSHWLRKLVGQMEDMTLVNVDVRLARYLLRLAEEQELEKQAKAFPLPMQKQVLAAFLATTPPTLSRAFRRLEKNGVISLEDRMIQILDPEGLEDLAASES